MKIRGLFTLIIASSVLTGCMNKDWMNIPNEEKGGEEYANLFRNTTTIDVDITSTIPNAFYSIYYEYPYNDEGDLVAPCFMQGTTPIHTTLDVPKDVQKLYILGNNEINAHIVSDVAINSTSGGRAIKSRSNQNLTQEVLDLINNKYFPEKANTVRGSNLYKCTDICVSDESSEKEFEEADVWLTYIGDGGLSKANMYGKMWFYTYPSDKYKTITVNDCTFYGFDLQQGIVEKQYSKISGSDSNVKGFDPIFWSKTENTNVNNGIHSRVKLGRFPKGVNIGFAFKGTGERVQFTTPALNLSVDTHKYLGITLNYKDGSGSYKIENPVGNGFICHIETGNFEGNVIGMENRTPNHVSYDGDYNDMICLLETNPVDLKTKEEIPVDDIGNFTVNSGLLLFEDNYPDKGDFDFNDVVIKYNIKDYYKTENHQKVVTASILAKGCNYSNEFGYYDGTKYNPIFKGISGYKNVSTEDIKLENIESKTVTLYGKITTPYINNGTGYVYNSTYNTDEFPYVLDIPISNDDKMFRWCIESKRIDDAYNFGAPRTSNWYVSPKDDNLVIK